MARRARLNALCGLYGRFPSQQIVPTPGLLGLAPSQYECDRASSSTGMGRLLGAATARACASEGYGEDHQTQSEAG